VKSLSDHIAFVSISTHVFVCPLDKQDGICVLLTKSLSPAQQAVVPAPTRISLLVWLLGTKKRRPLCRNISSSFYSFSWEVV
jgi:hypothetical protein